MRFAIVNSDTTVEPKGGVKQQGYMWKSGLEKFGHVVDLIDMWQSYDWSSYDAIIVFSQGMLIRKLAIHLSGYNKKLVFAPIIDPTIADWKYKILCKWWGAYKYTLLSTRYHDMYLVKDLFKLWLVRSEQEFHYVNYCLEIPKERIVKVPLHYRIESVSNIDTKENFCLHVSRLSAPGKNVARLIAAAKKYGFELKLAGALGDNEKLWFDNLVGDAKNIEYLGMVSDAELKLLYQRAKVFALPSLIEGVGMVALEAAAYGCEIVLTNIDGPKEYYEGRAIVVNPYSVDEIGKGVLKAMTEGYSQPELKSFVEKMYSEESCMRLLEKTLKGING